MGDAVGGPPSDSRVQALDEPGLSCRNDPGLVPVPIPRIYAVESRNRLPS